MMFLNNIIADVSDEWNLFKKRHSEFFHKFPYLIKSLNNIFIREVEVSESSDRVIFFLGRLCVEDFMEILLLCGEGYGIGGMKLLRGMYERAVTLGYLAKHPEKADDFLGYHSIHLGKHFNHANQIIPMEKILSPEKITEIQESYKMAKEKYKEKICKCGKTRTMFSWSRMDIASMASEAGMDQLYLQCYYEPTLQAHATVSSLIARIRLQENGHFRFDDGAQREKADSVLMLAHNVMLFILEVENNHFNMGLENEIQERFADFMFILEKENAMS